MSALRQLDARGSGMVLLLSALWGGNIVAVKLGLADAPPLWLAWTRFALGGACVLAWGWWTRAPFHVGPGEGWPLLGLGLLFTIQLGLLNLGVWLSTAGHASVLLNTYAIHIVLIAHLLVPDDRLTPAKLSAVLLGYGGIVLLFADRLFLASPSISTMLLGDGCLIASAILLALRQVVLNRQLQYIHPAKPLLAQVVVGIPLFVLLSQGFEDQAVTWTPRLAGSLFYQGVVIAGFNFIANMSLLKRYRPSSLAVFALTTPLFAVLATALVLGESIGWRLVLSALLVAAGIAVSTLGRLRSARWRRLAVGAPARSEPGG